MSLRDEFEPLLLSPDGLHPDAAACAKAWDRETSTEVRLENMISLATAWLAHCKRSKAGINRRVSSFGLSKICERWNGGLRVLNGCFLMAAHRAGYEMEAQPPRYVAKIGRNDANAFLNICSWPDDGNRRPGLERREARV
jgi:hypothetical protein